MSNGHGEDFSGALLGNALKTLGHEVDAIPFVGRGDAYINADIRLIGRAREFSTGGLGYTSFKGRITELLQGQIFYLVERLTRVVCVGDRYDLLLVIGDIVPVFAAWLAGRPVVTYLVAYSSHYEGTLKMPWPCRSLLSNKKFLSLYSRDQLTAEDLSRQLRRKVEFLGNPFMDPILKPRHPLPSHSRQLGLLPGSRRPELDNNLLLILKVVELLSTENLIGGILSIDIALVDALDDESLEELVNSTGWILQDCECGTGQKKLVLDQLVVNVKRNRFVEVLQSNDAFISMAGTATEQAVGLAKPVIQLIGNGPQFTVAFAEAQRRLLGPTVFCVEGKPGHPNVLIQTARLTEVLLNRINQDDDFREECNNQASKRLGLAGGDKLIAKAIDNLLFYYQ